MQNDVTTSSQANLDPNRPSVSTPTDVGTTGTQRREVTDVASSVAGSTASALGRTVDYIGEEFRRRPLIAGSLLSSVAGAFVGVRIAQVRAMRRRRSDYEKIMDALAGVVSLMGSRLAMPEGIPLEKVRERGANLAGTARHMGSSIIGGVPTLRGRRLEVPDRERAAARVRDLIGLVPVALTLMRSPAVRNLVLSTVSKRMRRRR